MDTETNQLSSSSSPKTYISLLVLVIVGIIIFYWLIIRPSNIREGCRKQAISESILYVNHGGGPWEPDTAKRTIIQEDLADKLYNGCLHNQGLG